MVMIDEEVLKVVMKGGGGGGDGDEAVVEVLRPIMR